MAWKLSVEAGIGASGFARRREDAKGLDVVPLSSALYAGLSCLFEQALRAFAPSREPLFFLQKGVA